MICGSERFVLIVRDILSHHRASFKRASEKEEKCLQDLSVSIKNCSNHRQISFNCCKAVFIESTLLISSETAFHRVSAISTF